MKEQSAGWFLVLGMGLMVAMCIFPLIVLTSVPLMGTVPGLAFAGAVGIVMLVVHNRLMHRAHDGEARHE